MHTNSVAGVKPGHPTRAVQDAQPAGARRALDSLVISFSSSDLALTAWDDTCKACKLNSRTLIVSQQSGATTKEKIAALVQTIASLVEQGSIDLSTQVMVTGHGSNTHRQGYVFEGDDGEFSTKAVPFLQKLRQTMGGGPLHGDWRGTIHVGACESKLLSHYAMNSAGYTALHSGFKSVMADDVLATYDAVLRTLSTEIRTENGLLPVQVRRLWESACERTGENISLCGNGESFEHKAIDHDFDSEPNYAMNSAGYTALHSGFKSVMADDVLATYDAVLRTLSTEIRTENGLLPVQVRRLWESACERTGENISLCGNGESFEHKAIDHDFDSEPNPDKQQLTIFAKLFHGSVLSLERVLGKNPEEALKSCEEPEQTPLAQLATGKSIRDRNAKIELLVELKQDIDALLRKGRTALYLALVHGSPESVRGTAKTFLKCGANPWIRTTDDATAWQLAPAHVLDLFMKDPAGTTAHPAQWPDTVDPGSGRFPLHAACARGDLAWLEQHPPTGEELESEDEYGNTPLAVALLHKEYAMAEALLQGKPPADVRLSNKESLLAHVVTYGDTRAVNMLLQSGVDTLACEDGGMPLLLRAMQAVNAGRADFQLVELLLTSDAGKRSVERDLLLHYACHLGNARLLRGLLKCGLDPLETDYDGRSAIELMRVASNSNPDMLELGQELGLY